jgi:hypothetical protein
MSLPVDVGLLAPLAVIEKQTKNSSGLPNQLFQDLSFIVDNFKTFVSDAFGSLYSMFSSGLNSAKNALFGFFYDIFSALSRIGNIILSILSYPVRFVEYLFKLTVYELVQRLRKFVDGYIFGTWLYDVMNSQFSLDELFKMTGKRLLIDIFVYNVIPIAFNIEKPEPPQVIL